MFSIRKHTSELTDVIHVTNLLNGLYLICFRCSLVVDHCTSHMIESLIAKQSMLHEHKTKLLKMHCLSITTMNITVESCGKTKEIIWLL